MPGEPRLTPHRGPTRRRTLHVAGAALLTTAAATLADLGSGAVPAGARARRGTSEDGHRTPTVAADAHATAVRPAWARRWHHPVDTLHDFTERSRTTHFARKAIMLTIDDGPSAEWTPKYLTLLARYDIHATFCMIGEQVPRLRHLAKDVHEHGHTIANHTWNHDEALAYGSAAHIRSEIERTQHAIHTATGYRPRQFRNPGGAWGSAVYAELARLQMLPLGWSVDPRDWARPGTAAIERAILKVRPHQIILCHDGGGNRVETYHALEKVIPILLHRGYSFVTLPTG